MAIRVWGGGGANNLASNAANWVGGVGLTGAADSAQFDGTSAKDCTWDVLNGNYGSINDQATYTGTITITTDDCRLTGTFAGGSIDFNDENITIDIVDFSGATVYCGSGTITGGTTNGLTFSGGTIYLETATIKPKGHLLNTGATVDPGTSSVIFIWGLATSITHNSQPFYNLTLLGSGFTYTIGSGTWTVRGAFMAEPAPGLCTVDLSNNPDVNFEGNVTIGVGTTWTHGTGTTTFSGTTIYTCGVVSTSDLGPVAITDSLTLASAIRFGAFTNSGTFDAGGAYTITCDGATWTNTGTFIRQTSIVAFTSTTEITDMGGTTNKFYDVTIGAAANVIIDTKLNVEGTSTGTRTYRGTSSETTYTHDLTIAAGGVFASCPGGMAICTTPWWIGG
ncbi:MAG: hypothetical protein UY48_C0044G0002 [Candidatus Gottesmanbacteria bacterium GW2011_GWB1_49_7]|uniref:Uncharacterized protein n=1 Tax=Candidatus Gottesmanbacteria bacterium GW2011_GWB1_49_7 TaxID=1618448 RepID=A0A0G1VUQ3_9BACT|nr:MAG: hypothetical protein UY48_C0044G0002 [Candidatus Gottesmanbacteria bacterium GW2011_GWB1_49_7]